MVLQCNGNWDWNGCGSQEDFSAWLDKEVEELYRITKDHDAYAIKRMLSKLVAEYNPQDTECVLSAIDDNDAQVMDAAGNR
jgi:vacuolar-type H+-ATPase subunit E/Vma4